MRLRKARRTYGSEINIAPLIDVVFLLIIFFMTVSQFTRVEVEDLTLPEAEKGEKPKKLGPGRLIVNVRKDGRIVVSGRALSVESLERLLAEELKDRRPEDLTVLLRGDKDMAWKTAAAVMQACAAKGIARVRVAVVEPGAPGAEP